MRPIAIILFCCLPAHVLAQNPQGLTADEAVHIAVENNPRLSAVARDTAAAQAGVRSANAITDPSILFVPGLTGLGGTGEELLISQPLELNGTRSARTGIATARLQLTQAQSLIELRQLVFTTRSAYYELARAREQLALSRDLLAAAEEFERITRRQVELGSRPGIDQTQTEIETLRARQQVTLGEGQATAAQAALNTTLGRDPATLVNALAPLPTAIENVDRATALQQGLAARPEIAAEQARGEEFRQEARFARAQGRPDLAPQFRAGSVIRRFSDYGLGLAVTLPLFDFGSRRNRIRQAEESERAQRDRADVARTQVRQEVEQAYARLQAAATALQAYDQELLAKTQALLDASRKGFQLGQTSAIALLEAQRTYRAVQTERINAQVNYVVARAEWERATGNISPALLRALETKRLNRK